MEKVQEDIKKQERARKKSIAEKDKKNENIYANPVKEETYEKRIFTPTGEKIKTIKRSEYKNGIVKERLVKVEKNMGNGEMKRIF